MTPLTHPESTIADWVISEAEACQRLGIQFRAFTDAWFYYYPSGEVIGYYAPRRGQTHLVEAVRLNVPKHTLWLGEARKAFSYVSTRTR